MHARRGTAAAAAAVTAAAAASGLEADTGRDFHRPLSDVWLLTARLPPCLVHLSLNTLWLSLQ